MSARALHTGSTTRSWGWLSLPPPRGGPALCPSPGTTACSWFPIGVPGWEPRGLRGPVPCLAPSGLAWGLLVLRDVVVLAQPLVVS